MLHGPKTNEGTSSTQACFAMDGNCAVVVPLKVVIDNSEEVAHDVLGRRRPVNEEQIVVGNTSIFEMHFVIFLLIESDDLADSNVLEYFNIFIWVMSISVMSISVLNWSHEGSELAWDDPVEVTILNSLIVLILLHVERAEVIPAESDGILETLQDMKQSAIVEACTLGCITIRLENRMIWCESVISLFCSHLQDDYHECAHQEGTVDHFVAWILRGAIVENPVL